MRLLYFLIATSLLLTGCSKDDPGQTKLSAPELTQQYREKSVMAIVSVSETNIPTSGKIQMTIDIHISPDMEFQFPELRYFIEPFTVADSYTEPIQTLPNGKLLHRRVWQLAPKLPGKTVFQSIQLQAGSTTITTQPIKVEVTSLIPDKVDSFEIKDIAEPVRLLPEQKQKQRRSYIILSIVVTLTTVILLIKRLRRPIPVEILPAHEIAFLALENLPEDALARIHTLSEILTAFIGERFHLPSMGKTVDELIPLLPENELLGHSKQLEQFLVTGEQIRFSNKIPTGFAEEFETYVRSFIEDVKEEPCD